MAISFLLCKGTQDILEGGEQYTMIGSDDNARKSAAFARFFEQHIAVELEQTQALINVTKIINAYVADNHTLVKFLRHRISCSCLDEKYEELGEAYHKHGHLLQRRMQYSGQIQQSGTQQNQGLQSMPMCNVLLP